MERKYVNEEKYQKAIKVLKIVRIILVVLGVSLLAGGIVLMVLGFNQEPKNTQSPDSSIFIILK